MNVPRDLKYTKTHEWAKSESGKVKVGITDHAQHEITDVVHVELPAAGRKVTKGQAVAVVESVKAAFDIYAPVSGTISAVNDTVASQPELVNQSPYENGYLFVIEPSNAQELDTLLTPEAYGQTLSH